MDAVTCPECGHEIVGVDADLDWARNRAWCECGECGSQFQVTRKPVRYAYKVIERDEAQKYIAEHGYAQVTTPPGADIQTE